MPRRRHGSFKRRIRKQKSKNRSIKKYRLSRGGIRL